MKVLLKVLKAIWNFIFEVILIGVILTLALILRDFLYNLIIGMFRRIGRWIDRRLE